MKPLRMYAIGRLLFGVAALAAPALSGRTLAGPGGELPDAQAFLRGMGGREIGLGLGLLAAIRSGGPVRPWILAGVLADSGDLVGIAGAWTHMPVAKRWLGLATAGSAASAGAILLAKAQRD
jgi:hypothetical protein